MTNLELINQIKQLGFSENEAKCYIALLERESLMVSDIARLTGIARPNTYEAMKRLVIKGLSVTLPGDIKKYSASPPEVIESQLLDNMIHSYDKELENLEKRKKEIFEAKKTLNENAISVISQLNSLYEKSRDNNNPLEFIEVLKNPYQIHRKFLELYNKAEKEVLGFIKPPFAYADEKQLAEQTKAQLDAADRRVIQRCIIQMPPADQAKEFLSRLTDSARDVGKGTKYDWNKVIDELPIKLSLFDDKFCFFAFEDPIVEKTSLTMLLTEHRAMAKSFRLLFESLWEKAKDFYYVENKKCHLIYPIEGLGEKE